MKRWVLFLFWLFAPAVFAEENVILYDWQTDFQATGENRKSCFIQFSGVNKQRGVFLSMNLSVVVDQFPFQAMRETTILRITAERIQRPDFSEIAPIRIHDAWLKTSLGSSFGKLFKINLGSEPYYLGGASGSDLFHTLLQGLLQTGALIGYREKPGDPEIVSAIPAPPPEVIIEKVMPCLVNILPDMDQEI